MSHTLSRRLRFRLRLSAMALYWERLWRRLWPAVAIIGAFIAIALLDVMPRLPAPAHLLVLVGFVGAFVYALLHALSALKPVGPAAARRRLDAAAPGQRPLAALADRLAIGEDDALASELWRRHQQRMAAAADGLSVRWPAPGVSRHEPWGIRAGVILLLVIAAVAGGRSWQERLLRAIQPSLAAGVPVAAVEAWITPPSYTTRPPVFLRGDQTAAAADASALHVPVGSTVLARVTGVASVPRLRVGDREIRFTSLASEQGALTAYRAETVIDSGEHLSIRAGLRELADWRVFVVPDRPPSVVAPNVGESKGNGLLDLGFEASDDYGVGEVVARIRPSAPVTGVAAEELRLSLATAEAGGPVAKGRALLDLASHPWAGTKVTLAIAAIDVISQSATGPSIDVVLPERTFSHPVAREIISERRRLVDATPDTKASVAAALAIAGADPSRFADDIVVALGLTVARRRLVGDEAAGPSAAVESVYSLLWELALRLEDGGIPAAERRLAEARQQLADALHKGAPTAEIERMMDSLRDALDEYLAALATELSRRPETELPPMPFGQTLRPDALRSLLDRARELSRVGARDEARALLTDLQRVLDGVRLGLRQGPASEHLRAAATLMQTLRDLESRQRALLDETYRQLRQQREQQEQRRGGRRGGNGGENQAGALAQRELRRKLGEFAEKLQERLGGIPGSLGAADQGMRDAARALAGDRLSEAVGAQGRAADALGEALSQAQDAISRQLGDGIGAFGFGPGNGDGGDPFGRPAGGSYGLADGDVAIPERAEIERIQELLRELRRRAGERSRPTDELDYIKRLLQPF